MEFEDALVPLEPFDAKASAGRAARLQIFDELANRRLEPSLLVRREATPVAEEVRISLIRWHQVPLSSDPISSSAAKNSSVLPYRALSPPAARASASSRHASHSSFCCWIADVMCQQHQCRGPRPNLSCLAVKGNTWPQLRISAHSTSHARCGPDVIVLRA